MTVVLFSDEYESNQESQKRDEPLIETVKKRIKALRSIDKLINTLIENEDKLTVNNLITYTLPSNVVERLRINLKKYKWELNSVDLNLLRNGVALFYITERIVYIPVININKMMKGIIEERGIKVKITREEFEDDEEGNIIDDMIKISVIPYYEENYNILAEECDGKLLILYLQS
ncbi:MAG: hypothetical protein ACTSPQ_14060 [Candidatus Helarchaeota archaeon]